MNCLQAVFVIVCSSSGLELGEKFVVLMAVQLCWLREETDSKSRRRKGDKLVLHELRRLGESRVQLNKYFNRALMAAVLA